jgi:hypothetical protein
MSESDPAFAFVYSHGWRGTWTYGLDRGGRHSFGPFFDSWREAFNAATEAVLAARRERLCDALMAAFVGRPAPEPLVWEGDYA